MTAFDCVNGVHNWDVNGETNTCLLCHLPVEHFITFGAEPLLSETAAVVTQRDRFTSFMALLIAGVSGFLFWATLQIKPGVHKR